jgi:hypothetical protein
MIILILVGYLANNLARNKHEFALDNILYICRLRVP